MSDPTLRRAFQVAAKPIAKIKEMTGAKTDTAAINYALWFTATVPTCKMAEITDALWLRDEIGRRVHDGGTVVIEKVTTKGEPPSRAELVLPPSLLQQDSQERPTDPKPPLLSDRVPDDNKLEPV